MMDLMELARRVEAAEGSDRELDALVAATQGLRVVEEGHPLGRRCYSAGGISVPIPVYTASLDAAMTLVPEPTDASSERFRLEGYTTNGVLAEHVRASAWVPGAPRVYAATPALALTAACLKALAQSNNTEGQAASL